MNIQEYISSGVLELYVMGSLDEVAAKEVAQAIAMHPELQDEVEKIESGLKALAEGVAPEVPSRIWGHISGSTTHIKQLEPVKSPNWAGRLGWAAAILCMGGIFWMLKQNNDLQEQIRVTTVENTVIQEQQSNTQKTLENLNDLLAILRSQDYETFTLPGNEAVAPNAYAKVYFNAEEEVAYIDTNGLPEAPQDKVYQVWSLLMNPLTPRNVGLIEATTEVSSGVFKFNKVPSPEAFGITLEPAGGSEGPTLSQLYVLGTVGQ